ncbi:MAG: hypothetical protein ACNS60_21250 [Candidatus Cyclobacteriaceae bacterium M2_1C_046]
MSHLSFTSLFAYSDNKLPNLNNRKKGVTATKFFIIAFANKMTRLLCIALLFLPLAGFMFAPGFVYAFERSEEAKVEQTCHIVSETGSEDSEKGCEDQCEKTHCQTYCSNFRLSLFAQGSFSTLPPLEPLVPVIFSSDIYYSSVFLSIWTPPEIS